MRILTSLFFLLISVSLWGQTTAEEYVRKGLEKLAVDKQQSAYTLFNKAIGKYDYAPAYFHRGHMKLKVGQKKGAYADFSKAIESDPTFSDAYYARATVLVSQQKPQAAIQDLDALIEQEEAFPNALVLRGKLLRLGNQSTKACEDWHRARQLGDSYAGEYLAQFCADMIAAEYFWLDWPFEEQWRMVSEGSDGHVKTVEYARGDTEPKFWSEVGSMQSRPILADVSLEALRDWTYEASKQACPDAQLTQVESYEDPYPSIIFTVECEEVLDQKKSESLLWHIVKSPTHLYSNYRALYEPEIPEETVSDWVAFFKSGRVIDGSKN